MVTKDHIIIHIILLYKLKITILELLTSITVLRLKHYITIN